jgi:hypothetical protein
MELLTIAVENEAEKRPEIRRAANHIPETPRLVNVGCCRFVCPAPLRQQRRGEGGWGLGKGPWGPDGPFPRAPRVDDFCERLSVLRRHERCFYQLSSSCSRNPQEELQVAAAQHGCAAVGGPNYRRVCPSHKAGAIIGWRGSFERTEKLFARAGRSALGTLRLDRRGDFTIRFSFLPDHIDQFA